MTPTTPFDGRTEQQRYTAICDIMSAMTYDGKLLTDQPWDGYDRRTGSRRNG